MLAITIQKRMKFSNLFDSAILDRPRRQQFSFENKKKDLLLTEDTCESISFESVSFFSFFLQYLFVILSIIPGF